LALALANRILETCTSPGTGAVTLLGAVTGYQAFSTGVGNGNTTYYCIADQTGANWEVGLGTYSTTGPTLTRTTPIAGSSATPVNFSSGTQNVFVMLPSEKAVYEDANDIVTGYAISGGSINNTPIGATTPNTIAGTNVSSATNPTNTVPALALTGTPNPASGGKTGILGVGTNFTASDKNILASFVQGINDYTQVIIQNSTAGTAASADFVVNNDNTAGAGTYGDFGINSSAFSGTGSLGLANATYLYSVNGDIAIGTTTSNAIHFVINSGATDAMTISTAGVVSLGTPLAITSGGTGAATAPAGITNLTGFTTTATTGGTTTLTNTSSYYQVFTGTSAQTVQLPATSTLAQGWSFHIVNNTTNILTINTSTSVTLGTISPGATVMPTALTTSGNTAADWEYGWTDFSVDARMVPQNAQTGNYTLATTDIGKHIYHAAGAGAAIYTIPANSAVPFEIGTTFTFINLSTTAPTIAITTDTMYLAGTGTTGTRTLAQYGVATAIKITATSWIISGSGLT
jgi:hypothetical protein